MKALVTRHSSLVTAFCILHSVFCIAPIAVAAHGAAPAIGACAHVGTADFAERAKVFSMMREAGLECVRTDLGWRICQPKPDAPPDFSHYDKLFAAAEAEGVAVLPILDWPPSWAKPVMEHLDEWRAFVRAAAEHYKGRVVAWEVWNEPNLKYFWGAAPNAAEYVKMLRVASEELRAVDPGTPICSGGLAGADSGYLEALYAAGGKDLFDIFAVHPYCHPQPPEFFLDEALGRMRRIMAAHGDAEKPIWITEMGWSTYMANVPEQNLLLAGLKVARPDIARWRIGCVGISDDLGAPEAVAAGLLKALPAGSTATAYTPSGLCEALASNTLDAVVYPFAEGFPLETLEAVRAFVADGGTLVDFGGAPMWFAYRDGKTADALPDGGLAREAAWKALRISVVFPGKERGIPYPATVHATPEAMAAGMPDDMNGWPCHRFFDAAKLKDGDRLVPLLSLAGGSRSRATADGTKPVPPNDAATGGPRFVAAAGAGEPPAPPVAVGACVLKFGSDYKGAIVLSGNMSVETGGVSEAQQADYLLRALPVAAKHNVGQFFIYAFRTNEAKPSDREAYYGIVHADYSPKPAYRALKERANKEVTNH